MVNKYFFAPIKNLRQATKKFNPMQVQKIRLAIFFAGILFFCGCNSNTAGSDSKQDSSKASQQKQQQGNNNGPQLDTVEYNRLMNYLANGDTSGRWPVKDAPLPLPGAILPFNRVVAYYGNLYSNRMGALAKWPKHEMIPKLLDEVKKWNDADSTIKSIPALHYIAVTAQGAPGKDGKYRYRMPYNQ